MPISFPEDFRRVSAIIDVDIVPDTHRRVRLMKNGSEKPLGFYIRDGVSVRVTPHGLEKVSCFVLHIFKFIKLNTCIFPTRTSSIFVISHSGYLFYTASL